MHNGDFLPPELALGPSVGERGRCARNRGAAVCASPPPTRVLYHNALISGPQVSNYSVKL